MFAMTPLLVPQRQHAVYSVNNTASVKRPSLQQYCRMCVKGVIA